MRDYQRVEKTNPWHLPQNLYKQTIYMIRDYYRLKEEYQDKLTEYQSIMGGSGKGGGPGDPTGRRAVQLDVLHDKVAAVENARKIIPGEYMQGIWNNILYQQAYPEDAHRNTYGIWKARYVFEVARRMRWV